MTDDNVRCHAVVPCAGIGARAGMPWPKQYQHVAGRPMVAHTLAALSQVRLLQRIVVVLSPDDERFESSFAMVAGGRVQALRRGGATRAASVRAGLRALSEGGAGADDWVLVHDAARCLVRPDAVQRLIAAAREDAVGALLALPLGDTLKAAVGDPPRVSTTLPRAGRWLAQTPQMFRLGLLERALDLASADVTDEASAVEALGLQPLLVRGSADNLKLTWPEDFEFAEAIFAMRRGVTQAMAKKSGPAS